MNVCPKDAIYVDKDTHCHIDQEKCIKCGNCFNQCPYRAISKIERPCAAACGMDAIGSDELGRAKINYDKCVSCGMCLVNCSFRRHRGQKPDLPGHHRHEPRTRSLPA